MAEIRLYNTASKTIEVFTPQVAKTVTMYHCGPTVYDYAHIGNMRAYVFADTIRRLFEHHGYTIKQVINITDVGHTVADDENAEDKVEVAAREQAESVEAIITRYSDAYYQDLKALSVHTEGTVFPRATEHIPEQIALIQKLEEKGFTYTIEGDGVYFDTEKFPSYGSLGNIDLEGMMAGARVSINESKRSQHDFALWKFSKTPGQRNQEWPSPWGIGFPGWHIECSAMSMKYLGETLDIHTGGIDHIPVHHNNEIAQSEAATGQQFVRYWMHNAFLMIDGQKMSKSLGNIWKLSDIVSRFGISPAALRYVFLTAHYRTSLNITEESLKAAEQTLSNLSLLGYKLLQDALRTTTDTPATPTTPPPAMSRTLTGIVSDDLRTPDAIARMWEMLRDPSATINTKLALISEAESLLGLDIIKHLNPPTTELLQKADARHAARMKKDFVEADNIKTELEALGYSVEDAPHTTYLLPYF